MSKINFSIRLAFRSFRSNRLIAVGSILCLFLGTLCISFLFTYMQNVWTKDDFHRQKKNIYMTVYQATPESEKTGICASSFLKTNYDDIPGIETTTTICITDPGRLKATFQGIIYTPEPLIIDSNFFKVFDFKLLVGDKQTILNNPEVLILTESFARKVFGKTNPIGKAVKLKVYNQDQTRVVAGIVQDPTSKSSIFFDFLMQLAPRGTYLGKPGTEFILTKKGFDAKRLNAKFERLALEQPYFPNDKVSLVSFDDAYVVANPLDMEHPFSIIASRQNDKIGLFLFGTILIVILLITSLNFSNLQFNQILAEKKKVSIHRIIGATTQDLFLQKLTESVLLFLIVDMLSVLAFIAFQPWFNQLAETSMFPTLPEIILTNSVVLFLLVFIGWIRPYFSIFKSTSKSGVLMRKPALIVQFTLSITLLIITFVVQKQLNAMMDKDPGIETKGIVRTVFIPNSEKERGIGNLLDELGRNPLIDSYTTGFSPFKPITTILQVVGKTNSILQPDLLYVGKNYLKVFGLKVIEGRFCDQNGDWMLERFVINETAKKQWGIQDISVGLSVPPANFNKHEIIGVIKDFNAHPLSEKPRPLVIIFYDEDISNFDFYIKFKKGFEKAGLESVKKLHQQLCPGTNFEYIFLTDELAQLYQKEKRLSRICILFTLIGLMITAIGLFTFVYNDTQRRIKEIGIRKVNGARLSDILLLLHSELIKAFAVAFVIACSVSWFAMHRWLQNFAYQTTLSWWIFVLAGLIVFVAALLTVSWQSWRTATRNPVEALRNE